MSEAIQIQLKKGVLELCVLALLSRADNYAYEIASRLAKGIDMGEGTIYPLMRRMQTEGLVETYLVESASGPPRKYYRLTPAGTASFTAQKAEWAAFTKAVEDILGRRRMTRELFLAKLRLGLDGLPRAAIDDIVADYETHFTDGLAAGRTEAEVADALGDPTRLARELRAEAGLKRWEEQKNPSAAAGAVFAVLGLGAIDILVLLPILMGVVGALFGLFIAVIACFFAGGVVFAAGPFTGPPGGPATAIFAGIGLMAGSASGTALLTLVTIGLVNALVWYGRLHYRLLKPAIEPQG